MNAMLPNEHEVDAITAQRVASLAAYDLDDADICATLQIDEITLKIAKQRPEYAEQFAQIKSERAKQAIDITTGWDSVEHTAVSKVLSALKHSENPEYALRAATLANRAHRRVGTRQLRTIDPSNVSQVVRITLNQAFVTNVQSDPNTIEAQVKKAVVHKRQDMPNQQQVKDLLAPTRPLLETMRYRKVEAIAAELHFGEIDTSKNDE